MIQVGLSLGSLSFVSAEQALGAAVDEPFDVYSVGLLMYWLLANKRPFIGDYEAVLNQQV